MTFMQNIIIILVSLLVCFSLGEVIHDVIIDPIDSFFLKAFVITDLFLIIVAVISLAIGIVFG